MTESSTVTTKSEDKGPDKGSKTVPVEALGEARAQKRAAQTETETVKAELAKVRDSQLTPEDLDSITAALAAEAKQMVDKEIAPFKERAIKAEMALQLGLSAEQADKVMEIKSKNPTLNDQQAFLLARSEHSEMFQPKRGGFDRAIHGSLPTSGFSDSRAQSQQVDYTAKMHEARASGDRHAAREFAEKEAVQRLRDQFLKTRSQ